MSAGSVNLNDRDLDELFKLADELKGVQDVRVQKSRYTAMLNDVLSRTDTAIDMQVESAAYLRGKVRYIGGIAIVLGILLIANFALTLSAVEVSKESHIKSGSVTDTGGRVVRVSSVEFTVGRGGEMVQRVTGTTGPVGTAPSLSKYKLSSRIPNKYLRELENINIGGQCSKDDTSIDCVVESRTARVFSFRREPKEGAHCGSVVVLDTDKGEFILDDDAIYHASDPARKELLGIYGTFALQDRRLAHMNISAHGRQLMQEGSMPVADVVAEGSFRFLSNVNTAGFECEMGGIIGITETITPPKPPVLPLVYGAMEEKPCISDDDNNNCESTLIKGWKAGVVVYENATRMQMYRTMMRSARFDMRISIFASQPLTRLVQIKNHRAQVETTFVLFRRDGDKHHCSAEPIVGAPKNLPEQRTIEYSAAYMGEEAEDNTGRKGSEKTDVPMWRWILSPITAGGEVSNRLITEYWERAGDIELERFPRYVFPRGNTLINPKLRMKINPTMSNFLFGQFESDLTMAQIEVWVDYIINSNPKTIFTCPVESYREFILAKDPFREVNAVWMAKSLREDDLHTSVVGYKWPPSFEEYWNAVIARTGSPELTMEPYLDMEYAVPSNWTPGVSTGSRKHMTQYPSITQGFLPSRRLQYSSSGQSQRRRTTNIRRRGSSYEAGQRRRATMPTGPNSRRRGSGQLYSDLQQPGVRRRATYRRRDPAQRRRYTSSNTQRRRSSNVATPAPTPASQRRRSGFGNIVVPTPTPAPTPVLDGSADPLTPADKEGGDGLGIFSIIMGFFLMYFLGAPEPLVFAIFWLISGILQLLGQDHLSDCMLMMGVVLTWAMVEKLPNAEDCLFMVNLLSSGQASPDGWFENAGSTYGTNYGFFEPYVCGNSQTWRTGDTRSAVGECWRRPHDTLGNQYRGSDNDRNNTHGGSGLCGEACWYFTQGAATNEAGQAGCEHQSSSIENDGYTNTWACMDDAFSRSDYLKGTGRVLARCLQAYPKIPHDDKFYFKINEYTANLMGFPDMAGSEVGDREELLVDDNWYCHNCLGGPWGKEPCRFETMTSMFHEGLGTKKDSGGTAGAMMNTYIALSRGLFYHNVGIKCEDCLGADGKWDFDAVMQAAGADGGGHPDPAFIMLNMVAGFFGGSVEWCMGLSTILGNWFCDNVYQITVTVKLDDFVAIKGLIDAIPVFDPTFRIQGSLRLCFSPAFIEGWIKFQMKLAVCFPLFKQYIGFGAIIIFIFTMWGGIKFTVRYIVHGDEDAIDKAIVEEWDDMDSGEVYAHDFESVLTASALTENKANLDWNKGHFRIRLELTIGVSAEMKIMNPIGLIPGNWGGRRRRRRRRRRHPRYCSCNKVSVRLSLTSVFTASVYCLFYEGNFIGDGVLHDYMMCEECSTVVYVELEFWVDIYVEPLWGVSTDMWGSIGVWPMVQFLCIAISVGGWGFVFPQDSDKVWRKHPGWFTPNRRRSSTYQGEVEQVSHHRRLSDPVTSPSDPDSPGNNFNMDAVVAPFVKVIDWAGRHAKKAKEQWNKFKDACVKALDWARKIIGALLALLGAAVDAIIDFAEDLGEAFADAAGAIYDGLLAGGEAIMAGLNAIGDAWNGAVKFFGDAAAEAAKLLEDAAKALADTKAAKALANAGGEVGSTAQQAVTSVFSRRRRRRRRRRR